MKPRLYIIKPKAGPVFKRGGVSIHLKLTFASPISTCRNNDLDQKNNVNSDMFYADPMQINHRTQLICLIYKYYLDYNYHLEPTLISF